MSIYLNRHSYLLIVTEMYRMVNTLTVTVIYLQFYTCASQDSLGLYKVSPIENHCVHNRIFYYNFVSPGTR